MGGSLKSKKWIALYQKAHEKADPYADFDIAGIPAETAIRHFYDPHKNEWRQSVTKVKIEPKAFGKGAMRSCYRMKKLSNWVHEESWQHASDYVAKCYTKTQDPEINRSLCLTDIKAQQTAKLFAELYNKAHPPKAIDMMQVFGVELTDRPGNPFYCVERYLEGEYIKYNSNVGYTDERRNTPQAFSHFTFEKSGGRFLVVDIQGVGDLYTDPQIHSYCEPEEFGEGNLGIRGYVYFFHTHRCNEICEHLGLKPFEHYPGELNVTMAAADHTTAWRSAVHFAEKMRQRASALGQTVSRRLHSLLDGPPPGPAPRPTPLSLGEPARPSPGQRPSASRPPAVTSPTAVPRPPTHHSPFHKGLICVGILADVLQGLAGDHRLRPRLQAAVEEVKSILEELKRDDEPAAPAPAAAPASAPSAGRSPPREGAAPSPVQEETPDEAAGMVQPPAAMGAGGTSALSAMIAANRAAGAGPGSVGGAGDGASDATSNASASVSRSDLGAVVIAPGSPFAERLLPDGASPHLHAQSARAHHTLAQVIGLVHRQLALMYDSEAANPMFARPADDALPRAIVFHYEKAAAYGCIAAQLALANALAGLPTAELTNAGLGRDAAAAFRWARAAAELGSRVGAIKAARALEAGEAAGAPGRDLAAAAAMYERAAGAEKLVDDDVSGSFELEAEDHELWGALGALYARGGGGLPGDGPVHEKAREAYLKAAEAAEAAMKAKKAAQYYAKAEEMEAAMG